MPSLRRKRRTAAADGSRSMMPSLGQGQSRPGRSKAAAIAAVLSGISGTGGDSLDDAVKSCAMVPVPRFFCTTPSDRRRSGLRTVAGMAATTALSRWPETGISVVHKRRGSIPGQRLRTRRPFFRAKGREADRPPPAFGGSAWRHLRDPRADLPGLIGDQTSILGGVVRVPAVQRGLVRIEQHLLALPHERQRVRVEVCGPVAQGRRDLVDGASDRAVVGVRAMGREPGGAISAAWPRCMASRPRATARISGFARSLSVS